MWEQIESPEQKCKKFDQKSKIWSTIKNQTFCQISKIWSEIENSVKNRKFGQKSKIWKKNQKIGQISTVPSYLYKNPVFYNN